MLDGVGFLAAALSGSVSLLLLFLKIIAVVVPGNPFFFFMHEAPYF